MSSSDTNEIINDVFIKQKVGRKKVYDVDYKQHVKDVKYNLKYYHAHKAEKMECERCNKIVTKFSIREHQKSKYCIAVHASKQPVKTEDDIRKEEEKQQQINDVKQRMSELQKKLDLLYSA
jgi:hypothetical protein